ncbi:hypothetical protein [Pseudooceanicola sp. HF7]|uniref:hypothetical protein n=1 Tax=Pseudooceanicola sp. HF7 TaxID=2721560 RepID=UPI0014307C81|nr:hypothetical protein [Pseudooceanicola sp. HF7]NIZ11148.1 hypothetical protein [Pseudooceanicola sp. HF7]
MTQITLTKIRLENATWEGLLSAPKQDTAPELEAMLEGQPLPAPVLEPTGTAGEWAVKLPVPPGAIGDGVRVVLILDKARGTVLASFAVLAGDALQDSLATEVALLRAELDMLKRAFRRQSRQG